MRLVDYNEPVYDGSCFRWKELVPGEARLVVERWELTNLKQLCWTLLDPLRRKWNGPLFIHPHGALRPEPYNTMWGGAEFSLHRLGCAADPAPRDPTPENIDRLAKLAATLNPFQLGVYDTFIHLGMAGSIETKHRFGARWDHRTGEYA